MAYNSTAWCEFCRQETNHLNHRCIACACRKTREDRAIWASKTNEEKIEELLKRIEKLEAGPQAYA